MADIIADIYSAASNVKPWGDVLTRMTQELGLKGSQMVGISASSGAVLFSHASASVPTETEIEYVRTYHGVDPRIPLLINGQEGAWLYDEDVLDPNVAVSEPYYRDLLIPYGGRFSASTKLLDKDGEVVLIAFLSELGMSGFAEEHRAYLRAIVLHLRNAAEIYQRTRRLTTAAFAGTELLRRMPRPSMLLGSDRTVSFVNDRAKAYLANGKTLFTVRGTLTAYDKAADADLATTFRAIAMDMPQGGVPKRRIVRMSDRHGGRAAPLSLTAFVPSESMYAFGTEPQVLLVVHEHAEPATPDVLLWEAAFDLTPSQSRVALEIFRGRTIEEAAVLLKIAATTVKSHLKEIYWKTETSRQAQLVVALAAFQNF